MPAAAAVGGGMRREERTCAEGGHEKGILVFAQAAPASVQSLHHGAKGARPRYAVAAALPNAADGWRTPPMDKRQLAELSFLLAADRANAGRAHKGNCRERRAERCALSRAAPRARGA
eukprot:gene18446-33269_t